MNKKRLSIKALRRRSLALRRRREMGPEVEDRYAGDLVVIDIEDISEPESEPEPKPSEPEPSEPDAGTFINSLAGFTAWLTMKSLSPASAARNLSHVVILFAWLASPLSISQVDIFGMVYIKYYSYYTLLFTNANLPIYT